MHDCVSYFNSANSDKALVQLSKQNPVYDLEDLHRSAGSCLQVTHQKLDESGRKFDQEFTPITC